MVFTVPSTVVSSLPLPVMSTFEPTPRYSLFKKVDGRWFQIRMQTHTIKSAVIVWGELVATNKNYSIRKASFELNEAR